MNIKCAVVIGLAITSSTLAGCSGGGQVEAARTANVVAIPTEEQGNDIYASAIPTDGGLNDAPTKNGNSAAPELSADNPTCEMVAETLLEYSAFAATDGKAAIDRVIEAKLVFADPDTSPPPSGEKKVLIQCDARVHWDAGYKSDLQYYLLLDSNGDLRVRWDGIENVEQG